MRDELDGERFTTAEPAERVSQVVAKESVSAVAWRLHHRLTRRPIAAGVVVSLALSLLPIVLGPNLLTKTDPGGTCATTPGTDCTRFSYDAGNQLKTISYSDGTPGVTYDYDNLGRRITMADGTGTTRYDYDSLSRIKSVTNGAGAAVTYRYDRANRQTTIGYPGKGTLTRTFDNANRLTSVKDWENRTTSFGYDPDSHWTTTTYPNTISATTVTAATFQQSVSDFEQKGYVVAEVTVKNRDAKSQP